MAESTDSQRCFIVRHRFPLLDFRYPQVSDATLSQRATAMERSPLSDPDPPLTVIDPSLIYTPTHTYASNASSDAGTSSPTPDVARSEHRYPTPNPEPASSRTQSQARDLGKSQRSPRPQDPPRSPYSGHVQRSPHLQRPSSSLRQRPYTPRARRPGPTSAPVSAVVPDPDGSLAIQEDTEKYIFTTYQDQTTLVIGVLVHLDALARQCEDMRTFSKTGFGSGHEDPSNGRSRVERCVPHPPSPRGADPDSALP